MFDDEDSFPPEEKVEHRLAVQRERSSKEEEEMDGEWTFGDEGPNDEEPLAVVPVLPYLGTAEVF